MRDQHYGVAQDMEVAEGTAGAAEGVELLPREEEPAKRRCVSSSPNKRVSKDWFGRCLGETLQRVLQHDFAFVHFVEP